MKQTAVEWLLDNLKGNLNIEEMTSVVEQSKEMEKEQIIEAHIEGFYSPPFRKSRRGEAEDYYDKIFKEK